MPGTRRLKRKLHLVLLSLEALQVQALICRLAVPAGSHDLQLCSAEGASEVAAKVKGMELGGGRKEKQKTATPA